MAKKELKLKEYMFNFKGGGWNTIWAKTLRGAVKAAKERYAHIDNLDVIEDSFRLCDKDVKSTLWALSR